MQCYGDLENAKTAAQEVTLLKNGLQQTEHYLLTHAVSSGSAYAMRRITEDPKRCSAAEIDIRSAMRCASFPVQGTMHT